jgi:hypothetical protein
MIKESTMKTLIAVVAALLALTGTASAADFGFASAGTSLTTVGGDFSRQAGAHADFTTNFTLNTNPSPYGDLEAAGDPKTVKLDLPPGLVGNPAAFSTCTNTQLVGGPGGTSRCPIDSQIGIAVVYQGDFDNPQRVPLYNMEQPADLPGAFAFNVTGVVVRIEPSVRPTDFGITATAPSISQAEPIIGSVVTLWGVPADSSHDPERWDPNMFGPDAGGFGEQSPGAPYNGRVVSSAPRVPFMTNPTSCSSTPSTFNISADSWQAPGAFVTSSSTNDLGGTPFVFTGCDRLPFAPKLTLQPGSGLADAPTGVSVDVSVPQSTDPGGLSTAHVRSVKVVMPAGMSVSPSSAAGLGACSLAQIKLGSDDEPSCPDSAKLGTVEITTPLLKTPLEGDVILAAQGDNPFRSLLAMYIVARGPGVLIKLPGRVDLNQDNGQLTVTFDNTPQLPFSLMHLEFRGGPRAPLATPTQCGRYTTHYTIASWAGGPAAEGDTPMTIDQGCSPRGFTPSFSAGTTYPAAGEDSPFTLTLTRADRQASLSRIDATLPAGLLARIASVPQCAADAAAAGTCALGTEVGTTSVLSGPGESPLSLTGRVYLTGPYGGAPFGLSIVVPTAGQAGPFDLGNVVVRAAIFVDRTDAHVTVKSDPLPQIIQGFPLRLRQVVVSMNRPGFMFNPTSCAPTTIGGTFGAIDGQSSAQSVAFRPVGCGDLGVNYKLGLSLTGKSSTKDGTHPGVNATVTSGSDTANLRQVTVKLPLSVALDPDNAQALCTTAQRAALNCPKASIVGTASARSILPHTLTGPVYFVKGERKSPSGRIIATLPKLWIPLSADGVTIDLNANSDVDDIKRLVTTFVNIPDAPITSFSLKINGGRHGILVVSGRPGTCDRAKTIDSEFVGQNGKTVYNVDQMKVAGCRVKVTKSSSTSKAVTVRLSNLTAGRLSLRGAGVSSASRTLKGATAASITAKLTSKARAALRKHKSVRLKLSVSFLPKGEKEAVKVNHTVTVRR